MRRGQRGDSRGQARDAFRLVIVIVLLTAAGCPDDPAHDAKSVQTASSPPVPAPGPAASTSADGPPGVELFFGDLHVHTAWSFDAFENGVRAGPAEAYRFARGEAISHAAGYAIRLAGPPLDFLAVTDHAEYLGVATAALRDAHPLHRQPLIQSWLGKDTSRADEAARMIRQTYQSRQPFPALVTDEVLKPAWQESVALANAHDRPGVFTTLIGFEYSANPDRQNLHRNVIFRGARVPSRPFSSFDSSNPEDLWRWMDRARSEGDDLLAIPHNANGSNGLMFAPTRFDGSPIDADWAEQRLRNEPVAEIFQIKGQSDTTPKLSPTDEWADFEVVPWQTLRPSRPSQPSGSYVREAQKVGLAQRELGRTDPFALGVIGSSDGHNAASPVVESDYFGKLGLLDGTAEQRIHRAGPDVAGPAIPLNTSTYWSAAGLAGVWAAENSRAALFDALRRRETFATSGPRIRVQLYAAFDESHEDAGRDVSRLESALGAVLGVPMGGELTTRDGAGSPRFFVAAQQDPMEAPLERIQVIKLARHDAATSERVFDVACAGGDAPDPVSHRCPTTAPAPDPDDCRITPGSGARELVASWRDPDFSENGHALYFVRVLQVPTCRWSSFDAIRLGRSRPVGVPATIQERAVTSPIWIRPVENPG